MPKAKTPKTQTKSDFVRSLPNTMSAADVVTKAKDAGLKITSQLVYKVRGRAKGLGKRKRMAAAKPTVAVKKTQASVKPPESKAAFVRSLPASTPAKDVAKLAKTAGIRLDVRYVYNVRGAAKMKAKKNRAAAKVTTSTPTSTNGARPSVNANAETLLKAIGAELGLGKAIEILAGERARVASVISG
jgi:hypothetical protein